MMLLNTIRRVTDSVSYRLPMIVSEIYLYRDKNTYPVCPRCKTTLEREYQSYCDRCGQFLNWDKFDKALIVLK